MSSLGKRFIPKETSEQKLLLIVVSNETSMEFWTSGKIFALDNWTTHWNAFEPYDT